MSTGVVFLCPGQGAQTVGMGKALYDTHEVAKTLYDSAAGMVDFDIRGLSFEGPEEILTLTVNTQPCVFVLDVICGRLLEAAGVRPAATAGHSLGEYAACVLAGAMTFEDGLRLTRLRGTLMHEVGSARPGTMAAVMGLDEATVDAVLTEVTQSGVGTVVAANLNSPGQIVISGDVDAFPAAIEALQAAGAKRIIPLPVSGAFHSPLMAPAAEGLTQAISAAEIRKPDVPVVANVSAQPLHSSDAIREALVAQLTGRVRWAASMQTLLDSGHSTFVEVGPGSALKGMMRKIDRTARVFGVDSPESLGAVITELGTVAEPTQESS